jgi:predicted RNase H-like HicB family nuclease
MKDSARYVKIVEWSEEDNCFVGSSPGLLYGGCHGDDEQQVFEELCQVVEETIELYHQDGKPLPLPTSGRDFANKMQDLAYRQVVIDGIGAHGDRRQA